MILILTLALAVQFSTSPVAVTRGDLEFSRGVEAFVRSAAPDARPPEPYCGLMARLGAPKWADRDAASKALLAAVESRPGDARFLFWGRLDRDPEIGSRCNTILRRLSPCPACRGSGKSNDTYAWECGDCDGAATAWPRSLWD